MLLAYKVLHSPSMFAVKAKIYEVLYNQSSSIAFDKTQRQKGPNFPAFHWSPQGSLVSIGQLFVTKRVVHLSKRTQTSLITEGDQSGPNHLIRPGCAALHTCNSWFLLINAAVYCICKSHKWHFGTLTLLHSILAFLSAIGLSWEIKDILEFWPLLAPFSQHRQKPMGKLFNRGIPGENDFLCFRTVRELL